MNRIRRWLLEWAYRGQQVGEYEGIVLAGAGQHDAEFVNTVVAAMNLVERIDSRRFVRIKERIKWIINAPLFRAGGKYQHSTQACVIDFDRAVCALNHSLAVGWCARLLVHESTHGVLCGRGIPYSRKFRCRVERRCVMEDQRFVARLAESEPELASCLTREFDEANWSQNWDATWAEKHAWLWAQVVDHTKRSWAEFAELRAAERRHSS